MSNNTIIEHAELLIYLGSRYPRYTGSMEPNLPLKGNLRTKQRALKRLADKGFLQSLNSQPCSYRIEPIKFKNLIDIRNRDEIPS